MEDRRNNDRLATVICIIWIIQIWWLSPFTITKPNQTHPLGNYLLLVDYTGRLFREGKAVISAEVGTILQALGGSENWRAVAEAGRRSFAGTVLRGHVIPTAGSGPAPGCVWANPAGRVRGTLRLGTTAEPFHGSKCLGCHARANAVSALRKRVCGIAAESSGFSHLGRVKLPSILTPTARDYQSGGRDDATRVVLVPTPVPSRIYACLVSRDGHPLTVRACGTAKLCAQGSLGFGC